MSKPYFSLEGLFFQTPGTPIEGRINTQKAMQDLREYVLGQGQADLALIAIHYLEETYPSVKIYTGQFRQAFQYDDFIDSEVRDGIMRKAYNGIVKRINGWVAAQASLGG